MMSFLHKLRGTAYPVTNLLLFKLSWLLLVVGQESGVLWALGLQTVSLALHPDLRAALLPALAVALAGIGIDLLCQLGGLFAFPYPGFPPWLALLWVTFAFALPQGLGFLRKLPLPALVLVGMLLGPFSYGIGQHLGAVSFGLPLVPALLVLGAVWAVFLPLALNAARLRPQAVVVLLALTLPVMLPVPDVAAQEAGPAQAGPGSAQTLVGQARVTWFFRSIYEAFLYAESDSFIFPSQAPFIFRLEYRLDLKREQIVQETMRQWEKQQIRISPAWEQTLQQLIPDIRAGDSLALQVEHGQSAHLLHNDQLVGSIDDPEFVTAFAGIWLAETTTRPDLRTQLLGLP